MWWQPNVLFYQYSFRQLIFMRCLFLKSLKDAVICCILCVGFQGNRTVTSWLRGRVNAGTQLSEFPGYGLILSYCLSAYRWCSTPSPLNAKFTGLGFGVFFHPWLNLRGRRQPGYLAFSHQLSGFYILRSFVCASGGIWGDPQATWVPTNNQRVDAVPAKVSAAVTGSSF